MLPGHWNEVVNIFVPEIIVFLPVILARQIRTIVIPIGQYLLQVHGEDGGNIHFKVKDASSTVRIEQICTMKQSKHELASVIMLYNSRMPCTNDLTTSQPHDRSRDQRRGTEANTKERIKLPFYLFWCSIITICLVILPYRIPFRSRDEV